MRFLDGKTVQTEIEKLARSSDVIRMAVAFWGDGAPAHMGLLHGGGKVQIVCNLKMGGTNPAVIEELQAAGVSVTQSDHLHGKVYLFDSTVIIGSSNASANGLSLQSGEIAGWHEANVVTADETVFSEAVAWFEQLPKRTITTGDLARAKEAWSRRRKVGFSNSDPKRKFLIDALKSHPSDFEGRRAYLCIYSEDMSPAGGRALKAFRKQHAAELNRNWDAFEDWPELPDFSDLVCFWSKPNGSFGFDGFWHMPEERNEVRGKGTTIQLCWEIKSIAGFRRPGAMVHWKQALRRLKADMLAKGETAELIELTTFSERYLMQK